ncbi:hypothetical protein Lgra_2271 [Legionella gratiana]|uniref:Calpain catalytic domain-containing protein n=1 Tax=Legionella gratiana TaxID=45066 RepID=A0A378JLY4_9GAMM|nr:hypothetical protein [Legionella gratiana]KTD09036.1 hypothetical protein Lgra_2271 [Legionella gratiana]STX45750.1 Uncharacterised protein [Legionella gratiana]
MYTKVPVNDEELQHKKIRVTDKELKEILGWETTHIELSRVATPIKVTDIRQQGVSNCFMLAALGSILEKDNDYLNKLLKYNTNDNTVEISLQEDKEVWTYVLDATKIDSLKTNNHTHAAIFLLEKAYALHRILKRDKNDPKKEECDFSLSIQESKGEEIIFSSKLFKIQPQSFEYALEVGDPSIAYRRLGLPADIEIIPRNITLIEFKEMFESPLIILREGKDAFGDDENFFNRSFNQIIDNISLLLKLNALEKETLEESLLNFIAQEKQKRESIIDSIEHHVNVLTQSSPLSLHQNHERVNTLLISLFAGKAPLPEAINIEQIGTRIIESIPQKRGLKLYTTEQNEFFKRISDNLTQNKLVIVGSKEIVGTFQKRSSGVREKNSKGLVSEHAMHVVACYQRGGLKFLLIRNPWGHTVRDYYWKEKRIDNQTVLVLTAHAKTNLNSFSLFHHKEKPRNVVDIKNSTRNLDNKTFDQEFKKGGYFELELTDFTKRFETLTITKDSLATKVENKSTSDFKNFKKEYQEARKTKEQSADRETLGFKINL